MSKTPDAALTDGLPSLRVLVVEDDDILRLTLEDRLDIEGIKATCVDSLSAAQNVLRGGEIDLVVSDIWLPDGSGIDLFEEVTHRYPGIPTIMMTAYGEVSDAVRLIKSGAADYVTKPFDLTDLITKIRRHLSRLADTRLDAAAIGISGTGFQPGTGVLGKSAAMRKIERMVARLSGVDSSILITGESGVGKEVVANIIHNNSRRAGAPIVKVNCAALPENLIESELFGHEKGSFTGATHRRIGRFEKANGGTIFLDEIAEIPPETQVKLLRVLQERVLERVGGDKSINLDVRVIAATQVDLDEAIKNGRFRADLYWRLNVIDIHVPPLRERPEDVLYLARRFVETHARALDSNVQGLSADGEAFLLTQRFPGNVRELRNTIERAIALSTGTRLTAQDLAPMGRAEDPPPDAGDGTLRHSIELAERNAILAALERHGGVVGKAADALAISRKSLWEKMKRYGIER